MNEKRLFTHTTVRKKHSKVGYNEERDGDECGINGNRGGVKI
jgi:hypothetical protein